MDHNVMLLVLCCIAELGRAKSREVAESLGHVSVKYASLVLTRCKRRGYVARDPYKCGREHGYVYWLTKKGEDWIMKKAEPKKKETSGLSTLQVRAKNKDVGPMTSPILTRSPDLKSLKRLNLVLRFLMLKNEALKRENQKLNVWLGIASLAFRKCSSERDFAYWLYLSERKHRIGLEHALENVVKNLFPDMRTLVKAAFSVSSRTHFSESIKRMSESLKGLEAILVRIRGLIVQRNSSLPAKSLRKNDMECEDSPTVQTFEDFNERWWERLPRYDYDDWKPKDKCPTWTIS